VGSKITFDPVYREFVVTQPPDADGYIDIDLNIDLYSDAKEDWLADPNLQKLRFPIDPKGGDPFGSIKLGEAFLILYGWHFRPYEANHTLRLAGDIGTAGGWLLIHDTVGAYNVRAEYQTSSITVLREVGTSGLTAAESQALLDIAADQATITADIATISANVITVLTAITDLTDLELAERITNPSIGKLQIVNDTAMKRWEATAWEDASKTIPYKGEGLEAVSEIVSIAY